MTYFSEHIPLVQQHVGLYSTLYIDMEEKYKNYQLKETKSLPPKKGNRGWNGMALVS